MFTLGKTRPASLARFSENWSGSQTSFEDVRNQLLRFVLNSFQVIRSCEAFGVDLVYVLGSGGPRCEPASPRRDLQTTNRSIVCRCRGHRRFDWIAGEFAGSELRRIEGRKYSLLLRRSWRVDSRVNGISELARQIPINNRRILLRTG